MTKSQYVQMLEQNGQCRYTATASDGMRRADRAAALCVNARREAAFGLQKDAAAAAAPGDLTAGHDRDRPLARERVQVLAAAACVDKRCSSIAAAGTKQAGKGSERERICARRKRTSLVRN